MDSGDAGWGAAGDCASGFGDAGADSTAGCEVAAMFSGGAMGSKRRGSTAAGAVPADV